MPITFAEQAIVRAAIAAGRDWVRSRNGDIILRLPGGGYRVLQRGGARTDHGRFFINETGRELPSDAFDPNTPIIRRGRVEYIRLRSGEERAIRSWDPVRNRFVVTALGRAYLAGRPVEVVAEIPVITEGRRLDGSTYQIISYFPIELDGVQAMMMDPSLSPEQQEQQFRALVMARFDRMEGFGRLEGGRRIISEHSDEVSYLDETRRLRISTLRQDGNRVQALMQRPLAKRSASRGSGAANGEAAASAGGVQATPWPLVPCPTDLTPAALTYGQDCYCVPRQLSELLGEDIDLLSDEFTRINPEWRENHGITAEEIVEFCKRRGYGCHVFHMNQRLEHIKGEGRRTLCFAIEHSHGFFYRSYRRMLARMQPDFVQTRRLKQTAKPRDPPTEHFTEIKEGHYFHYDLKQLRLENLDKPMHLSFASPHEIRSIRFPKQNCLVSQIPEQNCEYAAFVQRLSELSGISLTYRNERVPALATRMLSELLRARREHLSGSEKKALLLRQDHKCAFCGEQLKAVEFDHFVPLSRSLNGQPQSFCGCCPECHAEKTRAQHLPSVSPLLSCLNPRSHKLFAEAPKPRPLNIQAHECKDEAAILVDLRRCRSNCLRNAPGPLPIFSIFDDVVEAEPFRLYDFCYVSKKVKLDGDGVACRKRSGAKLLANLPFTGNGWYSRYAVQQMLNTNVIKWSHITHGIDASAHVDHHIVREQIDLIVEAFGDSIEAKRSINSVIGLWCRAQDFCWAMRSTSVPDDEAMKWWFCKVDVNNTGLTDYFWRCELLDAGQTHLPLWLFVMSAEHTRVAQLYRSMRSLGVGVPCFKEVKTDAILVVPEKKRKRAVMQLAETTFRQLKKPKLLSQSEVPSAPSDDLVFRTEECNAAERALKGTYSLPLRHPHILAYQPLVWEELDPEEAVRRVLDGQSLAIEGLAGCGKTHFVKTRLLPALREAGKRCQTAAFTHSAALLLGGCTLHRLCYTSILGGQPRFDVLVIDEYTQIDAHLWSLLARLYWLNTQYIIMGDANQFRSMNNSWGGQELASDALDRSTLLQQLCGCNRLTLTECKRSDAQLFEYVRSLTPGGSRHDTPLPELLAEARQLFPARGEPDVSLCISHKQRRELNDLTNARWAPRDAEPAESQDGPFMLYVGQQLIGAMSQKSRGCANGCWYEVVALAEEVTLKCEISEQQLTVPRDFLKNFRLAHALTCSGCQGSTYRGVVRVYSKHPHFTRRHLLVCASRCTQASLLQVV